jgi:hypothetical protein
MRGGGIHLCAGQELCESAGNGIPLAGVRAWRGDIILNKADIFNNCSAMGHLPFCRKFAFSNEFKMCHCRVIHFAPSRHEIKAIMSTSSIALVSHAQYCESLRDTVLMDFAKTTSQQLRGRTAAANPRTEWRGLLSQVFEGWRLGKSK